MPAIHSTSTIAAAPTRCDRNGDSLPLTDQHDQLLAPSTGTQPKSLIRMFGPRGNPQARNLFGIIGYLQKQAGVELHVTQGPG